MRNVIFAVFMLFAYTLTAVNVTVYLKDQTTVHGALVTISSFTITLVPDGNNIAQIYNSQVAEGFMLDGSENKILFPVDPTTAPEEIRLYIHEAPASQQARAIDHRSMSTTVPDVFLEPSIGFGLGIQNSSGINEHFENGELAAGAIDLALGFQIGYRDCAKMEFRYGLKGSSIQYDLYNYDGTQYTTNVTTTSYRFNLKVAPWNINGNHRLNRFNVFLMGSFGGSECSFDKLNWELHDGTLTSLGLEISRISNLSNSGEYYDLAFTLEYEQNRYEEWDLGIYGTYPQTVKINTVRLGVRVGLCINLSGSSQSGTP